MSGRRREFAARREQGGEVEDEVDLVLGQHPVEQLRVEDRADVLLADERCQFRGDRVEIERDNRALGVAAEATDEAVTDLAAGPGDKHDRFAEHDAQTPAQTWASSTSTRTAVSISSTQVHSSGECGLCSAV